MSSLKDILIDDSGDDSVDNLYLQDSDADSGEELGEIETERLEFVDDDDYVDNNDLMDEAEVVTETTDETIDVLVSSGRVSPKELKKQLELKRAAIICEKEMFLDSSRIDTTAKTRDAIWEIIKEGE